MKLKSLVASVALAAASIGASAATITNADGTFAFTGFDWDQSGVAWTSGLDLGTVGSSFTEYYVATATGLKNGSATLATPGLGGSYEYTIFATITETVVFSAGNIAQFQITGGSYSIYYDTSADASYATGNGFLDGTQIISGTIAPGATSTFIATATGGAGIFTLNGTATASGGVINPALVGTNAVSTLQFGDDQTPQNSINASTVAGTIAGQTVGGAGQVIFQADANQSFTFAPTVPEPSGLALVGTALAGLGFAARRRKQA